LTVLNDTRASVILNGSLTRHSPVSGNGTVSGTGTFRCPMAFGRGLGRLPFTTSHEVQLALVAALQGRLGASTRATHALGSVEGAKRAPVLDVEVLGDIGARADMADRGSGGMLHECLQVHRYIGKAVHTVASEETEKKRGFSEYPDDPGLSQ